MKETMDLETQLPTIDFSNLDLEGNSPRWEAVKSQVHKALVEYGCFEALFNKVPLDLRKAMLATVEDIFNLPQTIKQKLQSVSDEKPYLGYDKYRPTIPLFEGIGIEDPNVTDHVESVTKILCPEGNPSLSFGSKTIQSYSKQLTKLDHITRKMILEVLGVEKHLEEHLNLTNLLLRIQKYKSPYANKTEAWSNGRLRCPHHRVMMSGKEARYSVALFSNPKPGCMIKAPEELVDEQHPLLSKPFDYGQLMKFHYARKEGQSLKSSLRDYCGV